MKIDDIYNSDASLEEKLKESIKLYEITIEWYDKQPKDVQSKFKPSLDHMFDMCNIIGSNVPVGELSRIWDEVDKEVSNENIHE